MNTSSTDKDPRLLRLFSERLVPWTEYQRAPFMVATDQRHKLQVCNAVEVTPRKTQGKEISGGGGRHYRNASPIVKSWPQDHLNAINVPKLACVISGCADLQFYDYELRATESTFILIPPDVPQPDGSLSHVGADNPMGFCEICWMLPRGDKVHFWMCRCEGGKHTTQQWCNVIFLNPQLTTYQQLLHQEMMIENKTPPSLTSHLLHLFMMGMQREVATQSYLQLIHDEHAPRRMQNSVDPIVQAQSYVAANFSSNITLQSVARIVGMSRSLFAQQFKTKTGQTLGAFLTARRLQEAKLLLRQSEWTVATISDFVGFNSPAHFYDLFRRDEQCSPGEYRNSHQK